MSIMHIVDNDQASTHYQVLTFFLCKFATFIGLKTIVTHENVCLYYEANK